MNATHRGRLGLLATMALAGSAAGAQSPADSVRLYGVVGASLNYKTHQKGGGGAWDLRNSMFNSSLFGLRGSEDLGGGLVAQFRLESSIASDTGGAGGSGKFWDRQSYVGLGWNRMATVTVGRQFSVSTDRVVQSLDVFRVAGSSLDTQPLALFGVNRFVGNDTRVDDSVKLRLNGPAGTTLGLSTGLDDGSGRSYAFDLAQLTSAYTVAVYGTRLRSPNVIAATGVRPEHEVVGAGAQLPLGATTLYLNLLRTTLDATAAGRPRQENRIVSLGVRHVISTVVLKAAYTRDRGTGIDNVVGRDGTKQTTALAGEYEFSRRTAAYAAVFNNRFSDGYRLDPLNIAALNRDAAASGTTGYSVGVHHSF